MALIGISKPVKIRILLVFLIGGIIYAVVLACLYETVYPLIFQPIQPVADGDFPNQPVWIFEASEQVTATPLVYDSKIFIRTLDTVYALNSHRGRSIWQSMSLAQGRLSSRSQEAFGDNLVVPESNSQISALSVQNGDTKWKDEPSETGVDPSFYSIEDVMIEFLILFLLLDEIGELQTASELDIGDIIWEQEAPDRSTLSLTSSPEFVYLASGHTVEGDEIKNGTLLCRIIFNHSVGSILYDEGMVFITFPYGEYNLVAFDSRQFVGSLEDLISRAAQFQTDYFIHLWRCDLCRR